MDSAIAFSHLAPGIMNMALFWLGAMVVLLIIEAAVPGLVSIWFAAGSLVALIAALLHAPLWLQIVLFLITSVVCLCFTRPLVSKYVNSRTKATNADAVIGKECIVTEEISNLEGRGAVKVDGKVWTARMLADDGRANVGETRTVVKIQGVKLIVK